MKQVLRFGLLLALLGVFVFVATPKLSHAQAVTPTVEPTLTPGTTTPGTTVTGTTVAATSTVDLTATAGAVPTSTVAGTATTDPGTLTAIAGGVSTGPTTAAAPGLPNTGQGGVSTTTGGSEFPVLLLVLAILVVAASFLVARMRIARR